SPTGSPVRVGGSVMPTAAVYDPDLFETTPPGPLRGSAMNGFDKGIETLYARDANPVSDATAIHGLRLLRPALPRLDEPTPVERAVEGIILVQLQRKIGIVHAFGHGISRRYDVQQGVAHGVLVPHVLS
ncbi:MAG: iron-containing alcohol dehydrogenase, partial [Gemmatimonadetes bacterium]|nr:iron-containing alcohol dehydrogenase [Gemmatimonadota bacterium]NIR80931.1 iron-containing alcohol dehydrogenase [Gemmatimonadota bacterium]NIT89749.1 iron-containing alcohol dehydrogenase [Gemmatimonadota bacterium]NIU33535.1 iron-containing alcohol dehydrogenase [Gemmatimonadota bacterium]NIU37805.1 iron-containing alcohol dehydrogenase [Gemmatimonadota bacterium]